jgi:predicted RNase H-like HicB family nuclease
VSITAYERARRGRDYEIVVVPDSDGMFTAHVPSVPGVRGRGDTVTAARANARRALEGQLRRRPGTRPVLPAAPHERITVYPQRTPAGGAE